MDYSSLAAFGRAACQSLIILGGLSTGVDSNFSQDKIHRAVKRRFSQHVIKLKSGVEFESLDRKDSDARTLPNDTVSGFSDMVPDKAADLCLSEVPKMGDGLFLDVGAGLAEIGRRALALGAPHVLINDLSASHLAKTYIRTRQRFLDRFRLDHADLPPNFIDGMGSALFSDLSSSKVVETYQVELQQYLDRVSLVYGDFPTDFPNDLRELPFNQHQKKLKDSEPFKSKVKLGIANRLFHLYLDHNTIKRAAEKLYALGSDDVTYYITVQTPYNLRFSGFEPVFEANLKIHLKNPEKMPNPGRMRPSDYIGKWEHHLLEQYPAEVNLLVKETLIPLFEAANFRVIHAEYYEDPRPEMRRNGKERLLIIVKK